MQHDDIDALSYNTSLILVVFIKAYFEKSKFLQCNIDEMTALSLHMIFAPCGGDSPDTTAGWFPGYSAAAAGRPSAAQW
jgi:hypothetical protein